MYSYIVVDDEPLTRQGTIKKLKSLADQLQCVGEAGNGIEGIELIKQTNPDIIITDMNMPEADGNTFLVEIRKICPVTPIIVISGYKDFEYAQSAIKANTCKYILKPFSREEIISAMTEAINSLKVEEEKTDYIAKISEEHENIKYEYDLEALNSVILGYQTDVPNIYSSKVESFFRNTEQMYLLLISSNHPIEQSSITQFILENELSELCIYIPAKHNTCLNLLLINLDNKHGLATKPFINKIAISFIQTIEDTGESLNIGISDVHKGISSLRACYLEACEALNAITKDGENQNYFYNQAHQEIMEFVWTQEEEFLFRVENGETQVVNDLIYNLFEEAKKNTALTLGDMKVYCNSLIFKGKEIIKNYISINESFSSDSIDKVLNSIFSFYELQKYMSIFFSNIPALLAQKKKNDNDDIIDRVKDYIDQKYYNQLNLDFIANLFYLNPSYLSHIFKQKTGTTFSNYLTGIRVAKAKQLLLSTNKKPYQIAKAVGYDNDKYFFRLFKKETGYTPEEYRKNLKKG